MGKKADSYNHPAALAAALDRGGVVLRSESETAMRVSAALLVAQIRQRASGRPGPRVITGRYRASWQSEVHAAGPVFVAQVGSTAPQARRLEYGFVGTDSLGRRYAQPPFPHVGPAMQQAGPIVARLLGAAVERAL
ncbi:MULTISPECIES: HK97 gp10 family phage protein [unclassified Streptomyces]|uniref:HK97 gp10 family phage protein n=1 Tax=unclassified Streptomyces TaxID=2593676 RepID=UPI00226E4067|nr:MULTISPECIES: HK97 gp10 family phage protein [unclassified Streptomyces]MCY0922573.1 HK97 gp10 family phage protein [Streptomyces sp. H27-G5]MCY0961610.1 HK97 gp10 family phage protein [Streptomyces sp. H27-H5]